MTVFECNPNCASRQEAVRFDGDDNGYERICLLGMQRLKDLVDAGDVSVGLLDEVDSCGYVATTLLPHLNHRVDYA